MSEYNPKLNGDSSKFFSPCMFSSKQQTQKKYFPMALVLTPLTC